MLVLAVRRATVDGRGGKLGGASLRSIEAVHDDLAAWIDEHTGGVVHVDWRLEEIEGPIQESLLDDEGGVGRYNVAPWDLPAEVRAIVGEGRYDSVFLYAPIPLGFPMPARGMVFATDVNGAAYSTIPLPHRRPVHANQGYPPFLLPLHELWHQVELRAAPLGVDVPSNHEVLRVGGVPLDPRDWMRNNRGTVEEWYEHVFSRRVHPELWQALWAPEAARPVNLAWLQPDTEILADGLTTDGGFGLGEPLVTGGSVELRFDAEAPIERVVVHLAADEGVTAALPLEVDVVDGPRARTRAVEPGAARHVAVPVDFPERPVGSRVRVRATGEVPAGVRVTEIEVYERRP
jgi:hypothetical protein